VDAGDIHAKSA